MKKADLKKHDLNHVVELDVSHGTTRVYGKLLSNEPTIIPTQKWDYGHAKQHDVEVWWVRYVGEAKPGHEFSDSQTWTDRNCYSMESQPARRGSYTYHADHPNIPTWSDLYVTSRGIRRSTGQTLDGLIRALADEAEADDVRRQKRREHQEWIQVVEGAANAIPGVNTLHRPWGRVIEVTDSANLAVVEAMIHEQGPENFTRKVVYTFKDPS